MMRFFILLILGPIVGYFGVGFVQHVYNSGFEAGVQHQAQSQLFQPGEPSQEQLDAAYLEGQVQAYLDMQADLEQQQAQQAMPHANLPPTREI